MSANPDTVVNQGEFHSRVPPSEPLATKGHQPGIKVGNDAAPEFHAQTLPAGSAPPERTFNPNPDIAANPPAASNPQTGAETFVSAQDTIIGATSKDVHTGLGHPGSGQVASDKYHGKNEDGGRGGLQRVGANPPEGENWIGKRGLDREHEKGGKLSGSVEERAGLVGAEDRENVGAEGVASERA